MTEKSLYFPSSSCRDSFNTRQAINQKKIGERCSKVKATTGEQLLFDGAKIEALTRSVSIRG